MNDPCSNVQIVLWSVGQWVLVVVVVVVSVLYSDV